jgi:hypothetical protein
MKVDSLGVLEEISSLAKKFDDDGKVTSSFRRLSQLLVSAKLGGPNWEQLASRASEKLAEPAHNLAQHPDVSSRVAHNPATALECLKTATWKQHEDDELHPATQDPLYNEFCERFGENPEDMKSLVLYFTAETAQQNRFHTLNTKTRDFVGQSADSFAKTVDNILSFADEKKEENPDAFVESYGNLLSSLDFNEEHFAYHSKNFQHLPCFRPVAVKIPKLAKLLTIQENINYLNRLEPKVDPNKITVHHQQILQSLNAFHQIAKGNRLPPTDDIDAALVDSAKLVGVFEESKFTPDEYHQHLVASCQKLSSRLTAMSLSMGEPKLIGEKLKLIGDQQLFAPVQRIDANISVDELEKKLDELKVRLNRAETYKKKGII